MINGGVEGGGFRCCFRRVSLVAAIDGNAGRYL